MTFVPEQPWKGEWLGLDGTAPRAVPADAIVSLLTHVIPGDLLQKAILLGSLLLAGWGVLRLLQEHSVIAGLGAALLYVWNPYVYERLVIGHWGLMVGYAALPWVLAAALRLARRERGGVPGLLLWLAVAAAGSPTGGLLAGGVALAVVVGRGWRASRAVAGATVTVNLPWLAPALLHNVVVSDPDAVHAFAARADTPLGVLGSLLGFGGIWKESATPDARSTWLLSGIAVLVTLAGLGTLVLASRRRSGQSERLRPRALLAVAAASLLLAWLPATGPGRAMLAGLVATVPGAGILRDSQKLLMPFVLVACLGFGLALAGLRARIPADGRNLITVGFALLPLVLLPGLGWGVSGQLHSVQYPTEWAQVGTILKRAGSADERIVVLPWAAYRNFDWNPGRAALDPAIRFFPGEVLTNEDLDVGGVVVRSGDHAGNLIDSAIRTHRPLGPVLRELHVRWVLIEKGAPVDAEIPIGSVRHDGPQLRLVDLGSAGEPPEVSGASVIIAADLVTVLAVLAAGGIATRQFLRRDTR